MSLERIEQVNGHTAKRRKLSHGSSKDEDGPEILHSDLDTNCQSSEDEEESNPTSNSAKNPAAPVNGITSKARNELRGKSRNDIVPLETTKASMLALQTQDLTGGLLNQHDRHMRKLQPLLSRILESIPKISSLPATALADVQKLARKTLRIAIPWSKEPDPNTKYSFAFSSPSKIFTEESCLSGFANAGGSTVVVYVEMPSELFQEKDYLNHRAFHKRSFYLAWIASSLRDTLKTEAELKFYYQSDNELVPALRIESNSGVEHHKGSIEVVICFPTSVGPLGKTLPSQNCVRNSDTLKAESLQQLQPTPFYNSTLRLLSSVQQINDLVHRVSLKCESFRSCCILGQVWLKQRNFDSAESRGGFGLYEWSLMCALLLTGGGHRGHPLFSERYSTVQLFKAVLQTLSTRDLTDPWVVRGNEGGLSKTDQPMFFDAVTGVNVMYKMSPYSYQLLRHHASLSLSAVNSKVHTSFDATFITRVSEPSLLYDEIYSLGLTNLKINSGESCRKTLNKLYSTLLDGLGDRISLISMQAEGFQGWRIDKLGSLPANTAITVGFLVRQENASRIIDNGPAAEDQAAGNEFRKFWGDKAELRRFKDGRINESLVWSADSPVIEQIIRYVVARHFKLPPTSVRRISSMLESEQLPNSHPISSSDTFKAINNKYQALSSTLHQLEGLPLPIRSVSPASAALCSTSLIQLLDPRIAEPIGILIQFDSSTRWPDSLPAIQHTKIAFLVKLGDLLNENDKTVTTRVGLENTEASARGYFNNAFLDIIYPPASPQLAPIVFRLRIHHDRELHLIQTQLSDKTLHGSVRDELQVALQSLKRTFVASPSQVTGIRNLTTHFTFLSTTARLLKRWLSAHHLSNSIPNEILDILAAHAFLRPSPWSTPGSPTTAFLRILHFLSRWDWATDPLIIDLSLSQDMTEAQRSELATRFQAWRKLDPNMNTTVWFVGTNLDNTGTVWTQGNRPPRVVASRITALARAAMDLIKDKSLRMTQIDWQSLFVSPLEDFDFVIHLKSSLVKGAKSPSKSSRSSNSKFKNLQIQESLDSDSIGHDVVSLYLNDLERAFGSAVVFFYGGQGSGSTVIPGLWRPGVQGLREWRVRLGYSSIPVSVDTGAEDPSGGVANGGKCMINKEGMLAEMAILGEGLVETIDSKKG